MNILCRARKRARNKWGRIHLVDKCLLIILGIFMLQSAMNLFLAERTSPEMNTIDVVIRTSAAGIFGYLISTNFDQDKKRPGRQAAQGAASAASTAATPQEPAPQARIGFDTGGGGGLAQPQPPQVTGESRDQKNCDRTQILIVAAVGIVSLCVILVYRNWFTAGPAAAGTLTQFRDFVSGSVGFLISCSTSGAGAASET